MSSIPEHEVVSGERLAVRPLVPLRSENVKVLPPSVISQLLARQGRIFVPVKSQNTILSVETIRLAFSPSAGPVKPRRQVPPYLPDLDERLDDHRFEWDALLDWRQLASLDQLGQHRGLGQLLWPPGVWQHFRAFELADQLLAKLRLLGLGGRLRASAGFGASAGLAAAAGAVVAAVRGRRSSSRSGGGCWCCWLGGFGWLRHFGRLGRRCCGAHAANRLTPDAPTMITDPAAQQRASRQFLLSSHHESLLWDAECRRRHPAYTAPHNAVPRKPGVLYSDSFIDAV